MIVVGLVRRVAWLTCLWLLAGLFGAALVWLAPGFGIDERELDPRWTTESLATLRSGKWYAQGPLTFYVDWLSHFVRGDLGVSNSLGQPVADLLRDRLPITVRSVGGGLVIGWGAGLVLALSTHFLRIPGYDAMTTAATGALLCLPSAVLALAFLFLGAPSSWAIGAILLPQVFRYARNLFTQAASLPHVVTAVAKGIGPMRILGWHVLPSIAPQLVALAGVSVTLAFTSSIPVEVICDSPGIGQLAWTGAMSRDLPLLVNVTLIVTAITLAANAFSDWTITFCSREGRAS